MANFSSCFATEVSMRLNKELIVRFALAENSDGFRLTKLAHVKLINFGKIWQNVISPNLVLLTAASNSD